MARLKLSVAVGDYDRVRPLVDGAARIDAVEPRFLLLEPEEIFFRAFRHAEFDICELSLSSYCVQVAAGRSAYVGVPVFPSRTFRHASIYIRTDRGIAGPADLKGRRIGLPEYQLTANVWVRMLLAEHGVAPADAVWVRGGYNEPGRVEKIALKLPARVRLEDAPAGETISGMLASGALDAVIGPRAPACFRAGHPHVARLFRDPQAAAADWYRRTGIFPIMHLLGIRRSLAEANPWLPYAVLTAFDRAKSIALAKLGDDSAPKATLPFVEEQLTAARALMGTDFWPYGFAPNRAALASFVEAHRAQGLSERPLTPEELFHPSTLESHRV